MKYAEFNIDSNKIEFLNSYLGIEKVLLNGVKTSNKFSFTGTDHRLKLDSKDFILKSKYKLFNKREVKLELTENGNLIETRNFELDQKKRIYSMAIGIFVGFMLYRLLISLF